MIVIALAAILVAVVGLAIWAIAKLDDRVTERVRADHHRRQEETTRAFLNFYREREQQRIREQYPQVTDELRRAWRH
jgi:hypothetical protein